MPALPVICLTLAAAAASPSAPNEAPPQAVFADHRLASVVGERHADVSFAYAHVAALDRYLEYVLAVPQLRDSGARIELAELPGVEPVFPLVARGQMLITVNPSPPQSFSDRCAEAAALAWIGRASLCAGRNPSAERWLTQALAAETLAQLRPALVDLWYREALLTPPPSFQDAVAGKGGLRESFLLWRCVRQDVPTVEIPEMLLQLSRASPLAGMLKARGRKPEAWWTLRRANLALSRPPVSLGMRESSEALDDIAAFIFDLGAGDAVFTGPEIVPHRRLVAVRQGVEIRLRGLRREIIRQNPVYHNAWRALGVWLERFQEGEPAELDALWREFEKERAEAGALRAEIEAALAQPAR